MTDDLRTLAAMQRAAFDAAFPGLPPGLNPEEARRRINAALAAVLPDHRRMVLAEAGLSTTPRPLWEDADLAGLDTAEIIAWFIHWACHRRGACQCATPDDGEIDHGQRAASALRRIGRLVIALADATPAETGRAPARIDGAGRTGAGAGERVDDAQDDSGGRDG